MMGMGGAEQGVVGSVGTPSGPFAWPFRLTISQVVDLSLQGFNIATTDCQHTKTLTEERRSNLTTEPCLTANVSSATLDGQGRSLHATPRVEHAEQLGSTLSHYRK